MDYSICPNCNDPDLSMLKKDDLIYVCGECFKELPSDYIIYLKNRDNNNEDNQEDQESKPMATPIKSIQSFGAESPEKEFSTPQSSTFMATKLRINELSSRLSQLKRKDEKKDDIPIETKELETITDVNSARNYISSSPIVDLTVSSISSVVKQAKIVRNATAFPLVPKVEEKEMSPLDSALVSLLSSQITSCLRTVDQSVKFLSQVKDLVNTEKDDPMTAKMMEEQQQALAKLKKVQEENEKNSNSVSELERELARTRNLLLESTRENEKLKSQSKLEKERQAELVNSEEEKLRKIMIENHKYQTEYLNVKSLADAAAENAALLQSKIDNLTAIVASKDSELVMLHSQNQKISELHARLQEESEQQMRLLFDANGKVKNSEKRIKTLMANEGSVQLQINEYKEKLVLAEKEIEILQPIQIEFEKKKQVYQRTMVENQNYKAQLFENIQAAKEAEADKAKMQSELDEAFALSEEFAGQLEASKHQMEVLLQTLSDNGLANPLA